MFKNEERQKRGVKFGIENNSDGSGVAKVKVKRCFHPCSKGRHDTQNHDAASSPRAKARGHRDLSILNNWGERWIIQVLLAIDSYWRRESHSSLKTRSLIISPYSSERPHTHVDMGSSNWSQQVLLKRILSQMKEGLERQSRELEGE